MMSTRWCIIRITDGMSYHLCEDVYIHDPEHPRVRIWSTLFTDAVFWQAKEDAIQYAQEFLTDIDINVSVSVSYLYV